MKRNEKKIQCLKRQMEDYAKKDVIVAFSGGVDSSLLLKLACEAALKSKRKVYAVFLHTAMHPSGDAQSARRVAEEIGADFRILQIDELESAQTGAIAAKGICLSRSRARPLSCRRDGY